MKTCAPALTKAAQPQSPPARAGRPSFRRAWRSRQPTGSSQPQTAPNWTGP